jgi:hypothetical protein
MGTFSSAEFRAGVLTTDFSDSSDGVEGFFITEVREDTEGAAGRVQVHYKGNTAGSIHG